MADTDPCEGHECDHCPRCKSGRCCRRDNPGYQLPSMGEWEGPIHGSLGVLSDDGVLAQCHACGEYFGHLGAHVTRSHDFTHQEYKAIFGLNAGTGLIGPRLAKTRYDAAMERIERGEFGLPGTLPLPTKEQLSEIASRPRRLEHKLRPPDEDAIRKSSETRRKHYAEGRFKMSGWPRDPKVLAGLGNKALAAKRVESPEFVEQWKRSIGDRNSARHGQPPYPREKKCCVCGNAFTVSSKQKGRTCCGPECTTAFRRHLALAHKVAQRPEVRAKISVQSKAKADAIIRDSRGRIVGFAETIQVDSDCT